MSTILYKKQGDRILIGQENTTNSLPQILSGLAMALFTLLGALPSDVMRILGFALAVGLGITAYSIRWFLGRRFYLVPTRRKIIEKRSRQEHPITDFDQVKEVVLILAPGSELPPPRPAPYSGEQDEKDDPTHDVEVEPPLDQSSPEEKFRIEFRLHNGSSFLLAEEDWSRTKQHRTVPWARRMAGIIGSPLLLEAQRGDPILIRHEFLSTPLFQRIDSAERTRLWQRCKKEDNLDILADIDGTRYRLPAPRRGRGTLLLALGLLFLSLSWLLTNTSPAPFRLFNGICAALFGCIVAGIGLHLLFRQLELRVERTHLRGRWRALFSHQAFTPIPLFRVVAIHTPDQHPSELDPRPCLLVETLDEIIEVPAPPHLHELVALLFQLEAARIHLTPGASSGVWELSH